MIEYGEDTEWRAIIETIDGKEFCVRSGIVDENTAIEIADVAQKVYKQGILDAQAEIVRKVRNLNLHDLDGWRSL